jgi:redox-sensitive bicupin YhaK (pirin superfamily)
VQNVTATDTKVRRSVARVETKLHLGGDQQVDDRNGIIMPGRPELTDPFILLAEDWFSARGFDWHPHRGIETVTLVLDGVLEHGDNLGHGGALQAGDVQWMTAGKGIIHRELAFRNERAHVLQLWLNLPHHLRMVDSRYQDLLAKHRPHLEHQGAHVEVISGVTGGVSGPALNHWPVSAALYTIEPNQRVEHLLPARERAFAYVLTGEVKVGGQPIRAGQIAWSDPLPEATASELLLETEDGDGPATLAIYSSQPISETLVMGGPFVMNTAEEIEQAFRDLRRGAFGPIPNSPRIQYLAR